MKQLDYQAYELLREANPYQVLFPEDQLGWYDFSYPIFTNQPLQKIEDFWKIVAFAYSWMPTIPDIKHWLIEDKNRLLADLQALKEGKIEHREQLLQELIPVINNSLVGTSKVLHFIAPAIVPIIDSRVLKGWDIFFFQLYKDQFDVPKLPVSNTLGIRHIQPYLQYWDTLQAWVNCCEGKVSMRELEFCFYDLGAIEMPLPWNISMKKGK